MGQGVFLHKDAYSHLLDSDLWLLNRLSPMQPEGIPAFLSKTVGKGVLSKKDAVHSGAVGPVIRASGIPQDMRNNGYEAYGELDFEPVVHENCDVQGRVLVRLDECYQSIDLIKRAIDQLPDGPIAVKNEQFPDGEAIYRSDPRWVTQDRYVEM